MSAQRVCVVCGADISHKRADALTCGSGCRATKTRLEAEGKPLPYPDGRPRKARPRARRAGVEIYLTDNEAALLARQNGPLTPVAVKVERALARRSR